MRPSSGHENIYIYRENLYSVISLVVVRILNFQPDHVALWFIRIELIMCSNNKVDRVKAQIVQNVMSYKQSALGLKYTYIYIYMCIQRV